MLNRLTTKLNRRLGRRFVRLRFDRDPKSALGGILVKINRGAKTDPLLNYNTILNFYI